MANLPVEATAEAAVVAVVAAVAAVMVGGAFLGVELLEAEVGWAVEQEHRQAETARAEVARAGVGWVVLMEEAEASEGYLRAALAGRRAVVGKVVSRGVARVAAA